MPARIEAADNRATRVFGVGFGLAMVMLVPFGLVLVGLSVALAGEALGQPRTATAVLLSGLAFAILPLALANALDAAAGARVSLEGRLGRALAGTFRLYGRLGLSRGANPLLALFQSNEGTRKTGLTVAVVLTLASALVLGQFAADSGELDFGSYAGLPDDNPDSADVLVPQHYGTTRGEGRSPRPTAFIPDRVVRGPYLELFVPLRPRRHGPKLAELCGAEVAGAQAGGTARPALECLSRLLDVRLDGQPVEVPLDAASDPVSGLRGVQAMIPVTGLAPGRHEVTIAQPTSPRPGAPGRPPERIPFWR
jgi:hypothetical protein